MAVAVTLTRTTFTNTAAVAALALPLWATPVLGQETQGTDQAQQTDQSQQQAQQSGDAAQAATGQQAQGQPLAVFDEAFMQLPIPCGGDGESCEQVAQRFCETLGYGAPVAFLDVGGSLYAIRYENEI